MAAIYRAGKLLVLIIGVLAALALYIGFQMYTSALPRYGKGGVGIIAKNTYVLTRGARNIIQRYDSMIWAGDSVKTQTAFVPLQLVHFRPGQIYFFDFKTFRGGNYLRDIASLPPQMTKVLNEADRFILLSLFPNQPRDSTPPPSMPWNESFHDYPILGKTELRDKPQRSALLRDLYKSVSDSDGSLAMCFIPRHGIHATLGDENVDLVICFECEQVYAYTASRTDVFAITQSARPTFDRLVKDAGLRSVK